MQQDPLFEENKSQQSSGLLERSEHEENKSRQSNRRQLVDITAEENRKFREKYEKLKASQMRQQSLPAWRPIPTLKITMLTFLLIGILFLSFGIVFQEKSKDIIEEQVQYDITCKGKRLCNVTIQIP